MRAMLSGLIASALLLGAAGRSSAHETTPSDVVVALGAPAAGNVGQSFEISGWAIDLGATSDSGVDTVHIWAYPNPGSGAAPIFLGVPGYGYPRSDVAAIFGSQFTNSGWFLDIGPLAPGSYLLAVFGHSSLTGTFGAPNATRLITVVPPPTILTIDTPTPGATSGSPVFISGWAVGLDAGFDTGVDTVHIWAYPDPGSGVPPVFLGVAAYGFPRPELGPIYGWRFAPSGYRLSAPLGPGAYLIAVFAHSTVTQTFTVVQTRMVTVQ